MIRLIHSRNIHRIKDIFCDFWVYIGGYESLEQVRKVLPDKRRKYITKDIEKITDSVRDNFVDYIGKLSRWQNDKVLWYSSAMASKSISQTSIFHQYVYLKLLEEMSEKENEDILVVTDDIELLENIKHAKFEQIKVFDSQGFWRNYLCERIHGYKRVLKYLLLWTLFRFLRNRNLKEFDIFIHSWVREKTFSDLPRFTDLYLGDLEEFLEKKGYNVCRLTPALLRPKDVYRLHKHFSDIVYPLSYLAFKDLIKSIFAKLTITINSDDFKEIRDLEILNFLAKNEALKENRSKIFLEYLLLFNSYENLRPKIDNNAAIVYPFENQPWEKMLNLAFIELNRIAYQHSTIPYNWLDYRTSQFESKKSSPNVILTTGKEWSSFLKKYYQNSTIEEAGAIRFPHIFKEKRIKEQSKVIVMALSFKPTISIAMQRCLLRFLSKTQLADYKIKIKAHPILPKFAYLKKDFSSYKNCEFINESLEKLLDRCCVLITSGSTAIYEGVFAGVKTLCFVPEELSLGNKYFIKEHVIIAHEEDFSVKLEEILSSTHCPDIDIKEYFSYPDYNVFLRYLEGNVKQEAELS